MRRHRRAMRLSLTSVCHRLDGRTLCADVNVILCHSKDELEPWERLSCDWPLTRHQTTLGRECECKHSVHLSSLFQALRDGESHQVAAQQTLKVTCSHLCLAGCLMVMYCIRHLMIYTKRWSSSSTMSKPRLGDNEGIY